MTNQDFYQLIEQRLSELERKLSDVIDVRLCDDVRKTLQLTEIDLPISLGKARVILETVITDIYRRELPDADTKPLFNMIEALVKQKKNLFSEKRINDLNYIRINGNMVLHPDDYPDLTITDVEPVVLMVLSLVDWYLTQYIPNKQDVFLEDNSQIPLPDNPYRGLEAFRPEDENLFFGRNDMLPDLQTRVEQQRLVLMLGASGCGKSSLAYAGLIPALRRAGWLVAYFRPKRQAFLELAYSIAPLLYPDPVERGKQFKQLAPALEKGEVNLSFLLQTVLTQHQKSNLLLLVDQFEESYQVHSPQFHACLWEAVKHTENFTLLLTLRADFMGYALADSAFSSLLKTDPPFLVDNIISEQSLQAIIEQPAKIKNTKLEPLLMERIVRDVRISQHQISLPLLEFTLTKLWKKQQDRLLTHRAYSELGGVETALARHAEAVYERLKAAGQESVMRRTLSQLVSPGKDTADTKQVVSRSQFSAQDWEMVVMLANERLVVTNRHDDIETAELAHDSLISHWERLVEWLKDDRPFRIWQKSLQGYLQDNTLLSGAALATAQEWLEKRGEEIRTDEQALITRSIEKIAQEQAEKRRNQRRWAIFSGSALVTAAVLISVAVWFWQVSEEKAQEAAENAQIAVENEQRATQKAQEAAENAKLAAQNAEIATKNAAEAQDKFTQSLINQSRMLAGFAEMALKNDNPVTAMRLVLEALPNTSESHPQRPFVASLSSILFRAINHQYQGIFEHTIHTKEIGVNGAIFSPDIKRLLTYDDSYVYAWDMVGRQSLYYFHVFMLTSIMFSPDGQHIITASWDSTVSLWDANTGEQLLILKGHKGPVRHAVFSPDGQRIVTTSDDNTVRVWDRATGKSLSVMTGHRDTYSTLSLLIPTHPSGSIRFSSNGERFVTALLTDNTARLWDMNTGEQLTMMEHEKGVMSAVFSHDDQFIITNSHKTNNAKLWDANTGKLILELIGHQGYINYVEFSPNDHRVLTASNDGYVVIWDVDQSINSGANLGIASVRFQHASAVGLAKFSSDGQRIVTGSHDGEVRIWDANTGSILTVLKNYGGSVKSIIFSSEDKYIISVSNGEPARLWSAETGKYLTFLKLSKPGLLSKIIFSPDGQKILATESSGRSTYLWDANTTQKLAILEHGDNVKLAEFSLDSKRIVTASMDKTARIWDADTGKPLAVLEHEDEVNSAVFSPDGRRIVTASEDKTARIWDVDTGKPLAVLQGHEEFVRSAAYSPDGTRIVTASFDKTARIWDADTGKPLAVLDNENQVLLAVFSPDGRHIATVASSNINYRTINLWNENMVNTLTVHDQSGYDLPPTLFSPNGKHLITTHFGINTNWAYIKLWDIDTSELVSVLEKHRELLAISFDGNQFITRPLTIFLDSLSLLDVYTGKVLTNLPQHSRHIKSAAFSPDGRRVAIPSDDGNAIRIWLIFPNLEEMVAYAKKMIPARFRTIDSNDDGILNWRLYCHEREWYFLEEVARCKR